MKLFRWSFSLGLALLSSLSLAHNIQLNAPLPNVSVIDDGELTVQGDDIHYQPWHSVNLAGKVRVLHHFAGRSSVKEKNEPLMEALRAAHFDRNKYQTVTIVNADEAIIATGSFVKSSVEKGKKQNAHSLVVLDQKSSVKNAWQLKSKESSVVVLDKLGNVQFVSEGKLSPQQIEQVIGLVKRLIAQ